MFLYPSVFRAVLKNQRIELRIEPSRKNESASDREEQRARWPGLYSSRDTQVYCLWDYFPSGRLAMALTDGTRFRWGRDGLVGCWRDRKSESLEEYLGDAKVALVTNSVSINHRLTEEAKNERWRTEELATAQT